MLVGGPAGASIAAPPRGVKQEPGRHQPNAEHLDGATHLSSPTTLRSSRHSLTTVGCTAPTADRAGRPTQGHHQPDNGIAEQQDQRKHSIGNTASGMDRLTAKKDAQHPTVTAGSPRQR